MDQVPKVCVVKSLESFTDIIQSGGSNFREYTVGGGYITHTITQEDSMYVVNDAFLTREELENKFSALISKSKLVKFN